MKKCEVPGCEKSIPKGRLCGMHRQRLSRHGDLNAGRPEGWGKGRSNPAYEAWRSMNRAAGSRGGTDPRWTDFWTFLADMGEKPSPKHTLRRHDPKKGYWKDNCFWHEPVAPDVQQLQGRAAKAAYMRAYNREKPHILKKSQLKRDYGITLEEYEKMLAAQKGGCAICGRPETNIHRRTGQPMMLAVDHAHDATKKVRGLLCHAHNTGIGLFGDDPALLRAAASYLERHAVDLSAAAE